MGNFFNSMNDKLNQLMIGRNGSDKLARWSLGIAVALTIINMFLPNIICSVASYALLAYCLFRMFSRNIDAREEENEKFENLFSRFRGKTSRNRSNSTGTSNASGSAGASNTSKTHASSARKNTATTLYFTCDACGQSLSVPKGKGTLKVTCPKCKHQTTIKS